MTFPSAVIACAMKEEAAPFLDVLEGTRLGAEIPGISGPLWDGRLGSIPVRLAVTGIGLTNAAVAATLLLQDRDSLYVLAGTCGGLGEEVGLGEVVAGVESKYLHADAVAFGYQLGQIPGMPPVYSSPFAGESLPAAHVGLVLSGNSFVTADNVKETRDQFPRALSVDMETAAAAQTCLKLGREWISLRAVSDLCGPKAGEDFHIGLDQAAKASKDAVVALLHTLEDTKKKED